MTIRLRLFSTFICVALIPIAVMALLFFFYGRKTSLQVAQSRLSAIASIQHDRLLYRNQEGNLTQAQLLELALFYSQLGDTGETLIAGKTPSGAPLLLSSTRFPLPTMPLAPRTGQADLLTAATQGNEDAFLTQAIDYRGEKVVAVVRFVKEKGWWIIIKMDQSEVYSPLKNFYDAEVFMVLIFLILAVAFISILITQSIVSPIRDLTYITKAISMGNFRATLDPEMLASKNEVGDLSRAFDRTVISLKLAIASTEKKESGQEFRPPRKK